MGSFNNQQIHHHVHYFEKLILTRNKCVSSGSTFENRVTLTCNILT